jgi:putative transposase
MSRSAQLKFEDPKIKNELRFGGSLLKKAKNRHARPISSKDPMHLVLKSSKAKGRFSFGHKNAARVKKIITSHCNRYGVKMIEYSNNFNHLHLMLKFPSRAIYLRFIRSITGHLALAVSGATKLKGLKEIFGKKGFWDARPFTRVIRSFRGYRVARDYVTLNQLEALDIIPKRAGRLKDLRPGEESYFRGRFASG